MSKVLTKMHGTRITMNHAQHPARHSHTMLLIFMLMLSLMLLLSSAASAEVAATHHLGGEQPRPASIDTDQRGALKIDPSVNNLPPLAKQPFTAPLPGVYTAAPFTMLVIVPMSTDQGFVMSPRNPASTDNGVIKPELRLVPRQFTRSPLQP